MGNYILIEITIILVGIVLFFTLKNLLPSYFSEKGKNLATKEDVEEITKKVEKIKTDFVKEIELIKANLNYVNQNKFSIKTSEREALIEVNNKYSEWLNYLLNVSFSDINFENYFKLNDYYKEIKEKKLNFDIAQDNLHLFLHDNKLMKDKMECVTETTRLEFIVIKAIVDIVGHFNLRNIYFDGINSLNTKQKPNKDFIKEQLRISQEELDSIFYKMNEEKSKQFSIVHQKRVVFVGTLKQRLHNIMT